MRVSVYVPEASPEELNTSTMSDGVCSVSGTTVSPGAFHVAFTPNRGREGDVECALAYGGPGHAADPVGHGARVQLFGAGFGHVHGHPHPCLLYTSDAADDLTRVDLGGRRIIKKKK